MRLNPLSMPCLILLMLFAPKKYNEMLIFRGLCGALLKPNLKKDGFNGHSEKHQAGIKLCLSWRRYSECPSKRELEKVMSGTGVKVWDLFIRVFHWSLVILFVVTYFTGEEENTLHIYAGYAIGVLIVARFVWGFVGPKHAQFSDFVRRPSEVTGYMMAMLSGKAPHYDGHNPAGGYMVVALLPMIAVTPITGLKVDGEEGYGPRAGDMAVITVAYADDDDEVVEARRPEKVDREWLASQNEHDSHGHTQPANNPQRGGGEQSV